MACTRARMQIVTTDALIVANRRRLSAATYAIFWVFGRRSYLRTPINCEELARRADKTDRQLAFNAKQRRPNAAATRTATAAAAAIACVNVLRPGKRRCATFCSHNGGNVEESARTRAGNKPHVARKRCLYSRDMPLACIERWRKKHDASGSQESCQRVDDQQYRISCFNTRH